MVKTRGCKEGDEGRMEGVRSSGRYGNEHGEGEKDGARHEE